MYYNEEITKKLLSKARCKREYVLNIVSVILSLLVNFLLIYASYHLGTNPEIAEAISEYTGINIEFISFLSIFNSYAIIALLVIVYFLIFFYNSFYRIYAGLRSLEIDDLLNTKCSDSIKEYCDVLGIKKPLLFLNNSVFDSSVFGVKIRGNKAIGVSVKAYQSVALYKDYHVFNYQVCSTLGSIYLGHYDMLFQLATFWARIIPFYGHLYTRTLSYSTDRVAQILIGTESLVTAIGRETSGLFFIDNETMNKILNPKDITMTNYEKIIAIIYGLKDEYPFPYFRLRRVIDNDIKDQELISQEEREMKKVDEVKENDLENVAGGSDYGDVDDEDNSTLGASLPKAGMISEERVREHYVKPSQRHEKREAPAAKRRKY